MIDRAETVAARPLPRLLASFLSAALLVPASGSLFPALAQMRGQAVPVTINTPVMPVVVTPQIATILTAPTLPTSFSPTLGPSLNLVPSSLSAPVAGNSVTGAVATNVAASAVVKPVASGLQVIGARQAMPVVRSVAPVAARQDAAAKNENAPSAIAPRADGNDARRTAREENGSAIASAVQAANPEKAQKAFDGGVGFVPSDTPHQPQLGLDPKPGSPRGGLAWDSIHIPSPRAINGGVVNKILGWVLGPGEAIILPGNPQDEAGIERGLRELIRSRPELFSGLTPNDFRTRHIRKVTGQAGLADTFYANFQQSKNTLGVESSYINFVVKIFNGKTVVVGTTAELFPEAGAVDTTGLLNDAQLRGKATERLGTPPNASEELRDLDRKIMYIGGSWRTVQVYFYEKAVVMLAVDVTTGQSFAWDPRHMHSELAPSGSAHGRGVADGPHNDTVELKALALGHLQVEGPSGKFYTDAEGRFTVPGTEGQDVQLTFRLSGKFAVVQDQEKKDLVVTLTAKAGQELRVIFNPEGADAGAVAQVNAYYHTTAVHDWLVARGINLAALNKPMPVKVNIDDECNAYYTPWSPSLNFFKASSRCSNSSYNDVDYHEYGHAVDDAAGGIQNGGLSEGWGDIIAIYMTGQPIIGRGFIKGGGKDYIRNAKNTYKYNARDEVHKQGEAWNGFGWDLLENLKASMGDPARAAALAEALVIPVFLASVKDIPSAIQQVLLRDIDANGNAPHLREIQAAAAAHGIKVTLPKAGQREGLFSGLAATAVSLAQAAQAAPGAERFVLAPGRGKAITPADLEAVRKAGIRILALTPLKVEVDGDAAAIEALAQSIGWTAERRVKHQVGGTRNL